MFENDVNIFLGENGMGKTTILNCLYAVLSGRLEKLDNVVFEKIQIKFTNNEEFQRLLRLYGRWMYIQISVSGGANQIEWKRKS